jgi:hypothetical protein
MAQTFNYFRYTDNNGGNWSVKVGSSATQAGGLGWGSASASDPPIPKGSRLRAVYFLHPATQRKRAVPCATAAAFAALKAPGHAAVSLPDDNQLIGDGWNVIGGREEKLPTVHLIH